MRNTLDPKLDIVFKMLLGDPRNEHILIALLTDVLQPTSPIVSVTVLNPDTERANVEDKGAILDLYVRTNSGRRTLTEIQLRSGTHFTARSLFYWARAYSTQLTRGRKYAALEPVTGIFILNYEELPGARFHRAFKLLDTHDQAPLSDDLELHFIELPKLRKAVPDAPPDPVVRWARFLAAATDEELETLAMTDPMLTEAKLALDRLSLDPVARERAIKRDHELANFRYELELEHEKGREEGREEGREKGREEGREEGLSAGRAEGLRAAIEQLCVALDVGVPADRRDALRHASIEQLEAWHRRIVVERSWPE